ncbi:MAG: competence protein ComEA [Moraxellaceae bacterium]|jgi:competence protein ComEA|nr:competence protein ComEA [Moraxellaceae bacterium]
MNLRIIVTSALLLFTMPLALAAETESDSAPAAKAAAAAPAAGRINVNTADVMALTSLKGVGEKKAQAIVAYRKKNGPFNSLEQFEAVPGVGPSIVDKNRNNIVFR